MDRCYDLAEQVLFEILLYLPVISLLRFKAVCKNWFSLIESSSFISEHLKRSRDNKEDDLIILSQVSCRKFSQLLDKPKFALLSGTEYEDCVYDIDVGQFWHPANRVIPTGYCDGIIFLEYGDIELALWNPALKQTRLLPPSLFSDRLLAPNDYTSCSVDHSFGVDVKSNDYKVVRILTFCEASKNQVEVYSLGENSWRITHKGDVLPFIDLYSYSIISSAKIGKCFWVATRWDSSLGWKNVFLLSFDLNDYEFRTMTLPRYENYCHKDLDLLDDKVVYFTERDTDDDGNRYMEIWILHEFGVEMSWNLIYKFGPMPYLDLFYPRRISKNGEFLVCAKSNSTVPRGRGRGGGGGAQLIDEEIFYLYNLRTQQGKYHQTCNLEFLTAQIIKYNASLISLKNANGVGPITE